jgi:hypothetical protein
VVWGWCPFCHHDHGERYGRLPRWGFAWSAKVEPACRHLRSPLAHSNAPYRPPGKEDVSEPFLLAGESLASNHEHLEDFLTVLDVESPLKYHCSSSPRQASPCFVSSNSPSQRPNPSFLSWPTVVSAIAQNASAHVQPVSVARNAITLNMQIDTFHQSYTQWP